MRGVVAAGLILMVARSATATAFGTVEVSQPIDGGEGVDICTVTHIVRTDIPEYPVEVSLTARPYRPDFGPAPRDRNAASEMGLVVRLKSPTGVWPYDPVDFVGYGATGDTVLVEMDFAGVERQEPALATYPSTTDFAVARTVECVLLNAKRRWPRYKHVTIEAIGSDFYAVLSGTYSLERVPTPRRVLPWPSRAESLLGIR